MQLAAGLITLCSVLVPTKIWFAPAQPISVSVKYEGAITLVLTDFLGKVVEPKGSTEVAGGKEVDVRPLFGSALNTPGAYVLYAVPKDKKLPDFVGTPLVIEVRNDKRPGAPEGPIVIKVHPLRYAVCSTDKGDMTWVFWFDVAPNTSETILDLASQGFYDGLTFHRIVPGFVIQGGDPHGDGVGGPCFNIQAEFNDRKHEEGVLSMARNGDPLEGQGMKPRCEFANSAGSQFFVCLAATPFLDGKYTDFGKVVEGAETYKAIAAVPLADPNSGRPTTVPMIKKIEVHPVTADKNPYASMMGIAKPAK